MRKEHLMTSFEQCQSAFAATLRDPDRAPPVFLVGPNGCVPKRRFNIYRNNVYAGLTRVLEARYPAVQRLVGEEFFKAMARIFIEQTPPCSPVLIEYGSAFSEFLRTFEPVTEEPYLPDLALLEWRLHAARHAADCDALPSHHLADIDDHRAAEIRLTFAPSVSLVASTYPVFSLWRANACDEPQAEPQTFSGAESVLVTRPGLIAEAVRLPAGCAELLSSLFWGGTLGAAVDAARDAAPDFPPHRAIALLIAQKAIASVCLADPHQPESQP
jgi:hypothetical protein